MHYASSRQGGGEIPKVDAMQLVSNATVPDPYEPVIGLSLASASRRDFEAYSTPYRRRAEILAATRRSLAEEGGDRITIKSISDSCGISAQTVHNSFGCKADLLRSALNQHTLMIDSFAFQKKLEPEAFLFLAQLYCRSVISRPEFHREYMHVAFSPKQQLRDMLLKFGADLKLRILRDLGRRNLLRPFVDQRMAAEQIAYVNTFALLEWAQHGDVVELYNRIVHGNGSVLLGILAPEAGRRIENWLAGQFTPPSSCDQRHQ
jgi:AcrR family transcriptional regulator